MLENVPGSLAQVAEAFANAGINIEGICHTETPDKVAIHHFVVDQVPAAKQALESAGKKFSEEKILSLWYPDEPGIIAKVTRAFGDAGVNVETMYLSTPGKMKDTVLYVGVGDNDYAKAEAIAKSL